MRSVVSVTSREAVGNPIASAECIATRSPEHPVAAVAAGESVVPRLIEEGVQADARGPRKRICSNCKRD